MAAGFMLVDLVPAVVDVSSIRHEISGGKVLRGLLFDVLREWSDG
jgi:hypothetical protein